MIYNWTLDTGHQISVDNHGEQTTVTTSFSSAGKQQRTVNSLNTGTWSAPPEISIKPTGATLKIISATGECTIQIQGNSVRMQSSNNSDHQSTSSSTSTSSSSSSSTSNFTSTP
jgi:hypothetical protein